MELEEGAQSHRAQLRNNNPMRQGDGERIEVGTDVGLAWEIFILADLILHSNQTKTAVQEITDQYKDALETFANGRPDFQIHHVGLLGSPTVPELIDFVKALKGIDLEVIQHLKECETRYQFLADYDEGVEHLTGSVVQFCKFREAIENLDVTNLTHDDFKRVQNTLIENDMYLIPLEAPGYSALAKWLKRVPEYVLPEKGPGPEYSTISEPENRGILK